MTSNLFIFTGGAGHAAFAGVKLPNRSAPRRTPYKPAGFPNFP
jgi:hypothetical protein